MSSIWFRLMALEFKIRDYRQPRANILREVNIKHGFKILDFGCGPGSYILPASQMVGEPGKVYALDVSSIAINMVKSLVEKNGLKNVETILSDCVTGLPNDSIDVVLLYDVFHDFEDKQAILKELRRVLKLDGLLSFSDHHLKENDIVSMLTDGKLFKLQKKGQYTFSFVKTEE
jgi:ubiquinone/menaquinone biosynthesis C-methylase UbiE